MVTARPKVDTVYDEEARLRALQQLEILDSDPELPFETIVDLVRDVLKVPICAVSLIDRDRQWFKAMRGLAVSETERSISFCTHAIQQDTPFIVQDAARDPRFAENPLVTGEPGIGSYAGAQLKTKSGYNIGTLCAIDQGPREFSGAELSILTKFASLVIDEIEMREIATTDVLTGALSRRAWLRCAENEVHRALRTKAPLAFLMIDIDHFKQINDRFGHPVGDAVIREVAKTCDSEVRQSDWFGRFGGEEFVVAMPGTSLADAAMVAERIREAVMTLRLACLGDHTCTVSIGAAAYEALETNPELALDRADQALLRAKLLGRNRVQSTPALPDMASAAA
ncbi:sensor domain-containing diguanylate cyclase [Novosphingobium sp.]|uniref:sensor domain-containing diguanylate cyclase n=1 Tax=Novosphingobium sp. TaxID=1874826 RepID=UPI0026176864|nr:sensor domain-containing diguanylate cyclase [Novosphingobium sp.]